MILRGSIGLVLFLNGLSPAFADELGPQDAMNEEKVGIAARFIEVAPGAFSMGMHPDEPHWGPPPAPHQVTLTRAFQIQATELTQLQYSLLTGQNPSAHRAEQSCDPGNFKVMNGIKMCKDQPVESIFRQDAEDVIQKLNGIQTEYTYRLPTEAEWEYAARAQGQVYGKVVLDPIAWNPNNSRGRTHQVATKQPNALGLYDMLGNVTEWTSDWYSEILEDATDPQGPASGTKHSIRGGGAINWNPNYFISFGFRWFASPGEMGDDNGVRLVRTPRTTP